MNIEILKQIQFPHIKSQHLVTSLAGVFALVSIQNVAHFFIQLGHDSFASWTIGAALGAALVVLAHQLSEVDMRDRQAFYSLLSVTSIFTVLSGLIQGHVYAEHLGLLGYVLAFVLISCSELALPIAVSITEESKRKRKILDAGTMAREKSAEILVDVLDFDKSKLQKQAEKIMQGVVLANLSKIADEMTPTVKHNVAMVDANRNVPVTSLPEPTPEPPQKPVMSQSPLGIGASVDDMVAARQDKMTTRQTEMMSYIDGQDVAVFKNSMSQLFEVSTRTIERDIQALENAGLAISNGVIMLTEGFAVGA